MNVLFLQGGGGKEDYDADHKLVLSLQKVLGNDYLVHYPLLSNETTPDFGRKKQIDRAISEIGNGIIIVGHSLGASMLLKYLSESKVKIKISGIYLISTPFWLGEEEWKQSLKLNEDFPARLPKDLPIFFYHCRDDEEIPFKHLDLYAQKLPQAIIREIPLGGHQLNNDLTIVANDIKTLQSIQ